MTREEAYKIADDLMQGRRGGALTWLGSLYTSVKLDNKGPWVLVNYTIERQDKERTSVTLADVIRDVEEVSVVLRRLEDRRRVYLGLEPVAWPV